MTDERVIIHVDMDAFFASIEQRDNPALRGKPVIVGADPKGGRGRGVVSTCSYEARRFGVHSAQPISQAYRLCPHGVFVPVDGAKYGRESERIRAVFQEFTPQVEPVSIDEAFLDVTGSLQLYKGKRALAERLRRRIEEETGLTASLGVAPNKLVAKIASDLEKPRGLVVVEPDGVEEFLRPLEVRRLPGVGPHMRKELADMGLRTVGELAAVPAGEMERRFGEWGADLWRKARGVDESPVETGGEAKSISHEHTFETDSDDPDEVRATLMWLCEKTSRRLRRAGRRARTVTTKVRLADFTTLTRRRTLERPVLEAAELHQAALANLAAAHVEGKSIRLIGVCASGLVPDAEAAVQARQTGLFADGAQDADDGRRLRLARAEDAVKDRFGDGAIRRAASMRRRPGPER